MLKMKNAVSFTILLILLPLVSFSQNENRQPVEQHEHGKNEIGLAIAPAYFVKEEVITLSMHLHYIRTISHSKFGLGASFERIAFDPKHSTLGLVFTYRPIEGLNFSTSPGITFEDGNPGAFFALHLEAAYEFEIGDFHIGPAIEFARDPNDSHLSIGVHFAYSF
tara:strand:- start:32255 stop:32749 length:495 start_codon:yes stop_codon:yes gene_type:complete